MLTILDRYIGRSILLSTLLVLLVLLALATVLGLIRELGEVGEGSYTFAKAIHYILLTLPGRVILLSGPAVLLGSLLGLGTMASNSELTVMRAAGVSYFRVVKAVLVTGIAIVLAVALIGEYLVPDTEQAAEKLRSTALGQQFSVESGSGMWLKSGDSFVNIGQVMPDFTLRDVVVDDYKEQKLIKSTAIGFARSLETGWVLHDVTITSLEADGHESTHLPQQLVDELVNAEVLQNISISPESLSARDLHDQITYLKRNQLDSRSMELDFWNKLLNPLGSMVMLLLSLPFVFGNQRSGGAGQKIFIGIMLGISFVVVHRLTTQATLNAGFSPFLSAILPLFLFLSLAIYGIRRSM